MATVGEEICAAAGQEAMLRHLGDLRGTEPHHLGRTRLYVAWGTNPKATSVHASALLKDTPRVVVDPLRSETARTAVLHLRPRPGADTLLAMVLMRLVIDTGLVDPEFIRERSSGFEQVERAVGGLDLRAAARETGVPTAQARELVALIADRRPTLFHAGIGLQRNRRAGAVVVAVAMLGQVGIPGGGVRVRCTA